MGLPSINIKFKDKANSLVRRAQRGIVALILNDTAENGVHVLKSAGDIPTGLNDKNKKYINMALRGGVNPPSKVYIFVKKEDEEYSKAMNFLDSVHFNYMAVPGVEVKDQLELLGRIRSLTSSKGVKAVLSNCAEDNSRIINFTAEEIVTDEMVFDGDGNSSNAEYTANEYCARIAGILAGTPLSISSTYQVLPEVLDIKHHSRTECDEKIDKGELILVNDGEKVKIGRGVNSFVNAVPGEKGQDFKKIKLVDTMDMIDMDIRNLIEENYIGKVPNTYDNKCLLITAIKVYLEQLEREQILDSGKSFIGIDVESQRSFLEGLGMNVDEMDEGAIKEANTKDQVFLVCTVKIVDAMENITLNVSI